MNLNMDRRNGILHPPQIILYICLSICMFTSIAFGQSTERLLLRYQGLIEGELPQNIAFTCQFTMTDSTGIDFFSERVAVTLNGNMFSATLGENSILQADNFKGEVELTVGCDTDGDDVFDNITTVEKVGQTPRAAVAMSVEGPVSARQLVLNDTALFDDQGQWQGPSTIPTREGIPVINNQGDWVGGSITTSTVNADRITISDSLSSESFSTPQLTADDAVVSALTVTGTTVLGLTVIEESHINTLYHSGGSEAVEGGIEAGIDAEDSPESLTLLVDDRGYWVHTVDSPEVTASIVQTNTLKIGDQTVIDSEGTWVGIPTDLYTDHFIYRTAMIPHNNNGDFPVAGITPGNISFINDVADTLNQDPQLLGRYLGEIGVTRGSNWVKHIYAPTDGLYIMEFTVYNPTESAQNVEIAFTRLEATPPLVFVIHRSNSNTTTRVANPFSTPMDPKEVRTVTLLSNVTGSTMLSISGTGVSLTDSPLQFMKGWLR